ncbi:hypothetical protein HYFRA_00008653 [Hymenoscyphus fraxineus]|uniref:Uncharacterized protein n=1 Tax=Hymenoscyphus fraxineus TaxID=746836 RepID=A0A9N9PIU7_9HELO|nr:hypothetical protein HYFRA_00008653 [Hymenoscyphus fraxineus]
MPSSIAYPPDQGKLLGGTWEIVKLCLNEWLASTEALEGFQTALIARRLPDQKLIQKASLPLNHDMDMFYIQCSHQDSHKHEGNPAYNPRFTIATTIEPRTIPTIGSRTIVRGDALNQFSNTPQDAQAAPTTINEPEIPSETKIQPSQNDKKSYPVVCTSLPFQMIEYAQSHPPNDNFLQSTLMRHAILVQQVSEVFGCAESPTIRRMVEGKIKKDKIQKESNDMGTLCDDEQPTSDTSQRHLAQGKSPSESAVTIWREGKGKIVLYAPKPLERPESTKSWAQEKDEVYNTRLIHPSLEGVEESVSAKWR